MRESEELFNAQLQEGKNRAEELQNRKTQQPQVIFQIAEILAGPKSFQLKAQEVADIIHRVLDADSVVLRMLNKKDQTLDVIPTDGSRFIGLPNSLPLSEPGFHQRAFRTEKIMLIGDYSQIEDASPHAIAKGLKAVCTIGLHGPDGPTGLINIASRKSNHFNEERVELLEAIAGGITALFESARLTENLELTRREFEVTDEIARIITSTLDIGSGYEDYFIEVKKLVDFDFAIVALTTDDQSTVASAYSTDQLLTMYSVGEPYSCRLIYG